MDNLTTKQARDRARYAANAEAIKARNNQYRDQNREQVRAQNAQYMRERRASNDDVQFKLRDQQRRTFARLISPTTRLNAASMQMWKWLGITPAEFRDQLMAAFKPEWGFHNYGSVWVIDHIEPLVKHDLTDPVQCAAAWHHTNLRPLDKAENTVKGNTEDRQ